MGKEGGGIIIIKWSILKIIISKYEIQNISSKCGKSVQQAVDLPWTGRMEKCLGVREYLNVHLTAVVWMLHRARARQNKGNQGTLCRRKRVRIPLVEQSCWCASLATLPAWHHTTRSVPHLKLPTLVKCSYSAFSSWINWSMFV